MNDLRFYNFDFKLLHIEHDFSAVCWYLKYNSTGTFEAEFASSGPLASLCAENKYMVVCQGDFQAIITHKQVKNNKLILNGRTVNFLLEKRCVPPFSSSSLNFSNGSCGLAQYIVSTYCNDFVTLGKSVTSTENSEFSRNSMNSALDVICACLDRDNLGHRLIFDTEKKQWIFDIIKGEEKNIILSDDTLTTYDSEYTQNILDYATSGYFKKLYSYEGQWNPINNTPALTNKTASNYAKAYKVSSDGTYFGIKFAKDDYIVCKTKDGTWEKSNNGNCFWEYVLCDKQGVYRWDSILSAEDESEAKSILLDMKTTDRLAAKLRNLELGKDFNLGDIVTTTLRLGEKHISLKQRINAVTIWYEKGSVIGTKPELKDI